MLYVGLISDKSEAEVTLNLKEKNYRLQVQKNHLLAGDHCKKKKKENTQHNTEKRFQARKENSFTVYFYTRDK